MKTNIETLAGLLAASIWSDGIYDETERIVLSEIADALEIAEDELAKAVDSKLAEIQDSSEDEVNARLNVWGKAVDASEKLVVFETILQMMLSDGTVAREEVDNLLAVAEIMGIDNTEAVLLLLDMVNSEEDMHVEF